MAVVVRTHHSYVTSSQTQQQCEHERNRNKLKYQRFIKFINLHDGKSKEGKERLRAKQEADSEQAYGNIIIAANNNGKTLYGMFIA